MESSPQSRNRSASATGHFTFTAVNVLKAFAGDDLEWDEAADLTNAAYLHADASGGPPVSAQLPAA